jgi:hypothetical protein
MDCYWKFELLMGCFGKPDFGRLHPTNLFSPKLNCFFRRVCPATC